MVFIWCNTAHNIGWVRDYQMILKKFRLPFILFLILILPLLGGYLVPVPLKSFLYSISLSMKAVLLFILPFIIFSFVFSALLNLKSGVVKFICLLVGMVFLSNCTAILTGFGFGSLILPHFHFPAHQPPSIDTQLLPLWQLSLPTLISNQYALIAGFISGIIFSVIRNPYADALGKKLNFAANYFLKKVFTPLLPLFILGFVFKLEQDNLLAKALTIYTPVFFLVIGVQISYMCLLYFLVAKCSVKRFFKYMQNVLPASITGFSTVSSAASMPVLILCTEKNLSDPKMAEIVIPATINTHTLGSAIAMTILSLTTLLTFGNALPSLSEFLPFAMFYGLAKFAVAAVPGGAIIVATPLLETYLHFSGEMVGLITAIYMLFDPFGTATNVTGNGFFAILFSKIYKAKQPLLEAKEEGATGPQVI